MFDKEELKKIKDLVVKERWETLRMMRRNIEMPSEHFTEKMLVDLRKRYENKITNYDSIIKKLEDKNIKGSHFEHLNDLYPVYQ
tara:strand:- start:679 stop:930 length:252 start_codon:yes stop_codon:yes gene_type:complete